LCEEQVEQGSHGTGAGFFVFEVVKGHTGLVQKSARDEQNVTRPWIGLVLGLAKEIVQRGE
jgi:hypothetical protein